MTCTKPSLMPNSTKKYGKLGGMLPRRPCGRGDRVCARQPHPMQRTRTRVPTSSCLGTRVNEALGVVLRPLAGGVVDGLLKVHGRLGSGCTGVCVGGGGGETRVGAPSAHTPPHSTHTTTRSLTLGWHRDALHHGVAAWVAQPHRSFDKHHLLALSRAGGRCVCVGSVQSRPSLESKHTSAPTPPAHPATHLLHEHLDQALFKVAHLCPHRLIRLPAAGHVLCGRGGGGAQSLCDAHGGMRQGVRRGARRSPPAGTMMQWPGTRRPRWGNAR